MTYILLITLSTVPRIAGESFSLQTVATRDARILGLGGASTALVENSDVTTKNPAGLAFSSTKDFSLQVEYQDMISPDLFTGDMEWFELLGQPNLRLEALYESPGWVVSIFSDYAAEFSHDQNDILSLDVMKDNVIEIGFGLGFGDLALGVDVRASKRSFHTNSHIAINQQTMFAISDILQEVLFADYISSPQECFDLGLGVLYDTEIVSFGLYSEYFLDLMGIAEDGIVFDEEEVLATTSVGVAFHTRDYDSAGNYIPYTLLVTADLHRIGDDEARSLSLGLEGGFRLSESDHLSLRFGYSEFMKDWDLFNKGFSWDQGVYAVGATVSIASLRFDAVMQTGLDNILAVLGMYDGGLADESLRGNISCTIRM